MIPPGRSRRPPAPGADAPGWLTAVPFAHRGLHDLGTGVPENSLAAFERAAVAGCGVELDVLRTADGELAVIHEPALERLTGSPGRITRLTLADVRRRTLGGTDHGIPTLDEALAVIDGAVPVIVEVKNPSARVGPTEAGVAAALARYRGPVAVASFHPGTVRWFARYGPPLPLGRNGGSLADLAAPLRAVIARLASRDPDLPTFLSWELAALPNPVTDRWRALGRPLLTWTVTDAASLARAREHADNVIFEGPPPEGLSRQ